MDNRRHTGITSVGLSSLLTIFAVLCLTVFALLTLSSAQAAKTLSDRTAEASVRYYEADAAAEATLAALRAGELPEYVKRSGDIFSYCHFISDTQVLAVEVRLIGSDYEIIRWQAVSISEWEADDSLSVWDGK